MTISQEGVVSVSVNLSKYNFPGRKEVDLPEASYLKVCIEIEKEVARARGRGYKRRELKADWYAKLSVRIHLEGGRG